MRNIVMLESYIWNGKCVVQTYNYCKWIIADYIHDCLDADVHRVVEQIMMLTNYGLRTQAEGIHAILLK